MSVQDTGTVMLISSTIVSELELEPSAETKEEDNTKPEIRVRLNKITDIYIYIYI